MQAQRAKIQQLLGSAHSPLREQLLQLGFAALAERPLSQLASAELIADLVARALTHENVVRIAERHVLPGVARVAADLTAGEQTIRDAFTPEAERILRVLVASGRGPKLAWLRGALDPEDFRQLLAPVVQQVLVQFTGKLPIFGAGPVPSGGLGGLVGLLGKQVQKGAGQLADVGRSVMSGLGGEFERRMQAVARDFSQTATAEFRAALVERLRSDEGKAILARVRDRVLEHVLAARLADVAVDAAELPMTEATQLSAEVLAKLADAAWAKELLTRSIAGVFQELGQRSLADLLEEAGLRAAAEASVRAAVEPGLCALIASEPFGVWIERLLEESSAP